ncbi:MAG: hypothetical protein K2O40_10530, partial [Lachnospiraceae bacterium]|nr:hypothetical protein [Lachnospiraceae bacterium]
MGHTISGFDYMGDGYVIGLFRYVERDGLIQNLTVKGAVESENEKECMGSICGINHGTIKNCTFQGTVSGRDTVGGIAGMNERTGTIAGCSVRGRITGYYSTGGIVGINHGAVNNCTNRAGINDNSEWVEQDDEMGTGKGILESLTANDDNELYSGVDTGGIAGFSDGVISRCANSGVVGYEHTGYNIGGIAGRQSGVVSLCTNSGTVYGRKDIGGIVGQMEPFIEIDEAESLRGAINKLHDIIEKTIDDMDTASDGVKGDVDRMQSYADSAIDSGDVLVTKITDFVDENVDEVNVVSARMEHIIDMLPDVLNHVSAAGDKMSDLNDTAKQLSEDLAILDKLDDTVYDETEYSRLSLLSTVGGTLTADSANPQQKDTVTITVTPNDGYKIKEGSLTVKDAGGKKIDITPVSGRSDQYTFTMPKKNVKVTAQFVYQGAFLVKSTVGGRVTTTEDNDKLTFKASASSGYRFDGYKVGGSSYSGTVSADNEITLDRKSYIQDGTSTVVEAVFTKVAAAAHKVTVKSGTGGTAYVAGSSNTVAAGDEVTIHIVAGSEYVFKEMRVTGGVVSAPSSSNVNERVFKMPDNDVDVEVLFQNQYNKDSRNRIYPESNAGGTVSVRKGASGTQYQITIKPDENYDVDENRALAFQKVTLSGTAGDADGAGPKERETQTADSLSENSSEQETLSEALTEKPVQSEAQDNTSENLADREEQTEAENASENPAGSEDQTESNNTSENPAGSDETSDAESASGGEGTTDAEKPSESTSGSEDTTENPSDSDTSAAPEGTDPEETLPAPEEQPENVKTISAAVLGRNDLTYDSENKTYTYIVDLGDDIDSYSAYATFVKTQKGTPEQGTSYNITTASSTGGVVAVDMTSAKEGEKVYATPTPNNGYVLASIL